MSNYYDVFKILNNELVGLIVIIYGMYYVPPSWLYQFNLIVWRNDSMGYNLLDI